MAEVPQAVLDAVRQVNPWVDDKILRKILAAAVPVIAAAERERIAQLADEHRASYHDCPHPINHLAGDQRCTRPMFADLIRAQQ